MAKEIYSAVGGTAQKVQSIYTGVAGNARKVTKVYTGVNGVARLSWEACSISPVFAENTWEQIGKAIELDAVPDTWAVGDTKDITLTDGNVITMMIYGINHDDLPGGGKARFALGTKYLIWGTWQMNATNTNVGGFAGSALYAWLSGAFWNTLPAGFRAIIKPVVKRTSTGNMSSVIRSNTMPIFLLSQFEVTGTITHNARQFSFAGEGARYEIFTRGLAPMIRHRDNGTGALSVWWLRSPYRGNNAAFAAVNGLGDVITSNASLISNRAVCFGCCI